MLERASLRVIPVLVLGLSQAFAPPCFSQTGNFTHLPGSTTNSSTADLTREAERLERSAIQAAEKANGLFRAMRDAQQANDIRRAMAYRKDADAPMRASQNLWRQAVDNRSRIRQLGGSSQPSPIALSNGNAWTNLNAQNRALISEFRAAMEARNHGSPGATSSSSTGVGPPTSPVGQGSSATPAPVALTEEAERLERNAIRAAETANGLYRAMRDAQQANDTGRAESYRRQAASPRSASIEMWRQAVEKRSRLSQLPGGTSQQNAIAMNNSHTWTSLNAQNRRLYSDYRTAIAGQGSGSNPSTAGLTEEAEGLERRAIQTAEEANRQYRAMRDAQKVNDTARAASYRQQAGNSMRTAQDLWRQAVRNRRMVSQLLGGASQPSPTALENRSKWVDLNRINGLLAGPPPIAAPPHTQGSTPTPPPPVIARTPPARPVPSQPPPTPTLPPSAGPAPTPPPPVAEAPPAFAPASESPASPPEARAAGTPRTAEEFQRIADDAIRIFNQESARIDAAVKGSAAATAPKTAKEGRDFMVHLRVSPGQLAPLLHSMNSEFPGSTTDGRPNIRLTSRMEAQVSGNGFDIAPTGFYEQLVSATEDTTWEWLVTPRKSGELTLLFKLKGKVGTPGREVTRDFYDYDQVISVAVDPMNFVQKNWQGLLTVLIIPGLGYLGRYLYKRFWSSPATPPPPVKPPVKSPGTRTGVRRGHVKH